MAQSDHVLEGLLKQQLRALAERIPGLLKGTGNPNYAELANHLPGITYPTVLKIIHDKSPGLSWNQIVSIEKVLRQNGLGLLRHESIFDELASATTTFLLPGYVSGYRTTAVLWDFDAMQWITNRIEASPVFLTSSAPHRPVREFVPHDQSISDARRVASEFFGGGRSDEHLIVVASPRAFKVSRVVMEKILRLKGRQSPPFRFAWPHAEPWHDSDSPFNASQSELDGHPQLSELRDVSRKNFKDESRSMARGLFYDEPDLPTGRRKGSPRIVERVDRRADGERRITSYSIALATRINGRLRVVLAGLGGPESLAAAQTVENLHAVLWDQPQDTKDDHPRAVWQVVEAEITYRPATRRWGDHRELTGQTVCAGPFFWPPGRHR